MFNRCGTISLPSLGKIAICIFLVTCCVFPQSNGGTVNTASGVIEGTLDPTTGIRVFKGIPFAQPPVGDLRWREPQPPKNWTGVLKADQFGPRCPQRPVFRDMNFRSSA